MNKYLLSLISLLAGCSIYENTFDCPAGEGLKCTPLTKVNQLMDQGQIDLGLEPTPVTFIPAPDLEIYFRPYRDEQGLLHPGQKSLIPLSSQKD